jgi:glutamine synthetase type III
MAVSVVLSQYTALLTSLFDLINAYESKDPVKIETQIQKIKQVASEGCEKVNELQKVLKNHTDRSTAILNSSMSIEQIRQVLPQIMEETRIFKDQVTTLQ